eukprot:m.782036 g.782036  ORF g.782036 m.782036 type:complete len:1074 (-) comp23288_c0_seq4:149-3370(-)
MGEPDGNRLLRTYNEIDAALKRAAQAAGGRGGSGADEVAKLQAALPKIVVIGSQSAGKSSVLNRLSGSNAKLLAIGGGRTVTRTPIRLQLVCEETMDRAPYAYVYIQGSRRGDPIDAKGDNVDRAVRACTNELTGDQTFSQTEIVVEYHDTKVVPLTLVDLPGLMAGGTVETDVEEVKKIVQHFAVQENTIVVAVSKSTDDGANDPSFNLIRNHHPNQDWIAVHSKLDLLEADEDGPGKMREKVQWLRDARVGHVGKHFGVIAVDRNPEQLEGHRKYWSDVTETDAWTDACGEPVTFGLDKLSMCMHDKLLRGFLGALPELVSTLDVSIRQIQEVIETSPSKIDGDSDDLRKIVQGIITEVVDTIGPEPKSGCPLPDTIDQGAVLARLQDQLDGYVAQQQIDFLQMSIDMTYKKLKQDPSTMYQEYDHGDIPLFHEIISRFDPDNAKNNKLKDLINEAFEGYLSTIVDELVLPKLSVVKWKASSNERIDVAERFPVLCDRLTRHIQEFFLGTGRHGDNSLFAYISDTVNTILLLTARFAPAQSVKEHRDRAMTKDKNDLETRIKCLEELKQSEHYSTVVNADSERLLMRLTGAVKSWTTSPQESQRLLKWYDVATAKISQLARVDPSAAVDLMPRERRRMSGIVGSGAFNKQSYVKLTAEGTDAGKLRWYKTKDHWKTSATTPLGEFDIRRDKPLIERFDNKSGMQKKYGLCIRHGKQQKKFQWTSRTEREDMFQELVKWRDQGSTGEILFTGWFTKKGKAAWDGYRRRFFVLTGDQLRYYVSEGVGMGSHQKGTIHIRPSTVIRTKEEEVIITDSMSSDSTSSVKSRTWKLKADGGPDKAEELCRVISERASDAGRRALMNLHTDGPTIDESLMPKTPRGRSATNDTTDYSSDDDDNDGQASELNWLTEQIAAAEIDEVYEDDEAQVADIQRDLKRIYDDCFMSKHGTVAQYSDFLETSTQPQARKKQIVQDVADIRQQFSHACRYIGDQLKLELSKLFQLLRRQLDIKKDEFVDSFLVDYKGNKDLLREIFESGEDEGARRERAELRLRCYEEAREKCMRVKGAGKSFRKR